MPRRSSAAVARPRRPRAAYPILDREESWLQFNRRVLEEAADPTNPILERLRFLTIFHTNLDEFFMIRVSGIKDQIEAGLEVLSNEGRSPRQRLQAIRRTVLDDLERAESVLDDLLPQLSELGVDFVTWNDLSPEHKDHWSTVFQAKVHPILTPLAISSAFPFPFISGLSLNLATYVSAPDGEKRLVRIKIPDTLPRFVVVDPGEDPKEPPVRLIPIEELVSANLDSLFPGMKVGTPYTFRVTRDADLEIREDEADDLLRNIEEELRKRRFGDADRLEIDHRAPKALVRALQDGLHIADVDTFVCRRWVDVTGLSRVVSLDMPDHKFPAFAPRLHTDFSERPFDKIKKGDVLLHHPFDSFAPVAEFVRAAARDPDVMAIKQTLYRTSGDSPVIAALLSAVERGKQVAAVVELKARFDEENNITWARHLEKAGVHVIYGEPGFKIHAKLSLVVRREGDVMRRYAHIGTGNYNPITARVYTDLGLFTCDAAVTADVADLFNRMTGFARPDSYRKLLVAPRFMKTALLQHIHDEAAAAERGEPARIVAKCNAIIEPEIIHALYAASQAGVKIDLLVRGICGIVPGKPGLSENIRVRSVIGRFLEHSRVFWFHHGGDARCYIGSADMMGRNLDRRVEVLAPIEDPRHRTWIFETLLARYLADRGRTRVMQPDGSFTRLRDTEGAEPDVHQQFLTDRR